MALLLRARAVQPVTGTVSGLLKKQIFISHNSDTGKSKIKAPEDLVSGDSSFPGS